MTPPSSRERPWPGHVLTIGHSGLELGTEYALHALRQLTLQLEDGAEIGVAAIEGAV
jgi:hypothetical protein